MRILLSAIAFLFLLTPLESFAVDQKDGTSIKLTGQMRFRPEMQNNYDFNSDAGRDAAFTGQRIRLNFNVKAGKDIEGLITVQDTRYWGKTSHVGTATESITINSTSTPTDGSDHTHTATSSDSLDLYNAWFKLKNAFGLPIDVKVGRQTLVYGSQRLLGHLGWTDNARTHDAIKVIWKVGSGQVDLFTSKEDDNTTTANGTSDDENLGGLYSMWKLGGNSVDVYHLIWQRTGGRNVTTSGARLAGKAGAIDYTAEMVLQGGDWATDVSQEASAMAITAGLKMGASRIGIEYAAGSGDDKTDAKTHKTFVFPFHTNHAHYGYMDRFSWGNMNDIAIKYKTKLGKTVYKIDYHILSLAEAKDDWLNVVGTTILKKGVKASDGTTAVETEAGSEIDLTAVYPYSKNLKLVGGYSIFSPGAAVKERWGKDDAATWGYLMMIMNF